jgi:hypothetical protein
LSRFLDHTQLDTHPEGTSDQLVAQSATYATHNKQNLPVFSGIRTRDPSSQTASHCIATGIDVLSFYLGAVINLPMQTYLTYLFTWMVWKTESIQPYDMFRYVVENISSHTISGHFSPNVQKQP